MLKLIATTCRESRRYQAELLRLADEESTSTLSPVCLQRKSELEQILTKIKSWKELLSNDERFVVEHHLVEGLDISRVMLLYEERWGIENGKTERTFKKYQSNALKKIEAFELYLATLTMK